MSIKARIEIDNSELKNGLKNAETQASKSMKNVKKTVEGASSTFAKLATSAGNASQLITQSFQGVTSLLSKLGPVGLAAAAGIAAIGGSTALAFKGVSSLAKRMDSIGKSAKSADLQVNEYVALQHASSKAGIEMDKTLDIISKIDYAMTHAADGEKKYIDAFHALGIAWKDLEKYSPSRQLMEVADAYKMLKETGNDIPTEIYNIFSRRDMKTLNKMSSANYSQLVAEANVLGLNMDENQVKLMEDYLDTTNEAREHLWKMAEAIDKGTSSAESLNAALKKVNETIMTGNGYVAAEYADKWEGIGDVAEQLIKSGNISRQQKERLLNSITGDKYLAWDESKNTGANFRPDPWVPRSYANVAEEELNKALDEALKSIDFDKLRRNDWQGKLYAIFNKSFVKTMREIAQEADSRFNPDVVSTWTQQKRQPTLSDEEIKRKINAEKVEGSAVRFNNELRNTIENYDKVNIKAGKLLDADKEISKLQNAYALAMNDANAKLDEQLTKQIRLNVEKTNQLTIENRIKNLQEMNDKNFAAVYADMFSKTGGPDAGALKQVFDEFSNEVEKILGEGAGVQDIITNQIYKAFKEIVPDTKAKNIGEMLEENSVGLWQAMTNVAKAYKEGNAIDLSDIMTKDLKPDEIAKINSLFERLITNLKNYNTVKEVSRKFDVNNQRMLLLYEKTLLNARLRGDKERAKLLEAQIEASKRLGMPLGTEADEIYDQMGINQLKRDNLVASERLKLKENAEIESLELQIANARLQKRYDEEQQLKRILELKKRGLDADIDAAKFQKEFAAQKQNEYDDAKNKLLESITSQSDSALKNLYKVVPNGVSRSVEDMIEKVKEQFKNELPEGLEDMLRKFGNLTEAAGMLSLPKRLDDVIHTNELARRGGFSESVAVERRDNSDQIVSYLSKVNELIKDIKKSNDDISEKMTVKY